MRQDPTLKSDTAEPRITERDAAELLKEQFPDLEGFDVVYVGSGEDNDAFEVNGDLIFRFSKNGKASEKMAAEIRILPGIASRTAVPVPGIQYAGLQQNGRCFMGYRKLPGVPLSRETLSRLGDSDRDSVYAAIGDVVRATLETSHADITAAGIRELGLGARLARYYSKWEGVSAARDAFTEAEREKIGAVMHDISLVAGAVSEVRLVNTDLSADHVLFDAVTNKVTGVIDWRDLAATDPDFIFHRILQAYGDEALRSIVARTRPSANIRNIYGYALARSLSQMATAYENGNPDAQGRLEKAREILRLLDSAR